MSKRKLKRKKSAESTSTEPSVSSEATNDSTNAISRRKRRKTLYLTVPQQPSAVGYAICCDLKDIEQTELSADFQLPKTIVNKKNIVDICVGGMHTLLLTKQGHVYSYGYNKYGALGRLLDSDAENAENADTDNEPGLVELPGKAVKLSAGDSHSACLLENGNVMAWGTFRNTRYDLGLTDRKHTPQQLPLAIVDDKTISSIASGANHLVMLTQDGHVYTIGAAEEGQLGRISQRSVSGEGRNGAAKLLQPQRVYVHDCKRIEAIWATNYCTFVKESLTGRIFGFGANIYHQLAHDKRIEAVVSPVKSEFHDVKQIAGDKDYTVALGNDGSMQIVGDYKRQDEVPAIMESKTIPSIKGKKIVDISCSAATLFGLTDNGELYLWQLGLESEDFKPVRIHCNTLRNESFLRVACGKEQSVFLIKKSSSEKN